MTRRRRHLTREDLLHRYAALQCITPDEAQAAHGETDIENLRAVVESLEVNRRPPYRAQRASFAKAQPTTQAKGVTR